MKIKQRTINVTLLLIVIAYTFSILARFLWIYKFGGNEQLKFNNEYMINTHDGYFWAKGAFDLINGTLSNRSPVDTSLSLTTAFLVKVFPFSFETVVFYLSALFSSLIVIPMILIGRHLGKIEFGFISALISSIAVSYYNRTMLGYYDTDMLNIVFPIFLLWSTMLAINTKQDKYFLFTAIEIILYRWWYPQSYSLEFSFLTMIFIYIIYKKTKKMNLSYELKLLSIMLFAMLSIDVGIKLLVVVLMYIFFKKINNQKYLFFVLFFVIILFVFTGGINPIISQLEGYVFKSSTFITSSADSLTYYSVMQTIREAGSISYDIFAKRISGNSLIFLLSVIGYILLLFRHKVMLLSLPLVGLGFLGLNSGLRFTIYAVPIMGLGIGYLIIILSDILNIKKSTWVKYFLYCSFTMIILIPNINHIMSYKIPSVLSKSDVNSLDKIKNISNKGDYILSWWDYGYPLSFYTGLNNTIDGGKHDGNGNYPISYALTKPQNLSSQMLRLNVEFDQKETGNYIENMMDHYGYKNADDFLLALEVGLELPQKTRDVYLYLPSSMLTIYPSIELFSNLDLSTGKQNKKSFFYLSKNYTEDDRYINLGKNIKIIKKSGKISINGKIQSLKRFTKTYYDKGKIFKKQTKIINNNSLLSVIFMASHKQMLVIDEKTYNSTYFQLFILENYNKSYFIPIISEPNLKIYKLNM